jgi:hypothetical protein
MMGNPYDGLMAGLVVLAILILGAGLLIGWLIF